MNTSESVVFLRRRKRSSATPGHSLKTMNRQPFSNANLTPYTNATIGFRFHNVRKKMRCALNANWSQIQMTYANWVDGSTSHASYTDVVITGAIKYNGIFYPATFSGLSYAVVPANFSVTSDSIAGLTIAAGDTIERCFRVALPLRFKTQTINFQIGETITGATSGATGVLAAQSDSGTTGTLTLINETGTFVDSEIITGSLGGAAIADLVTTQQLPRTVSSRAFNYEGMKSTNNSATDWTISDPPCVLPVYTANITAGVITSLTRVSAGSGNSATNAAFYAYEVMADGTLQFASIATPNISGGAVNSATMTNGTAPTGYVWTTPTIVFCGGTAFGAASTLIPDYALMTGIPSAPVYSLTLIGDSVARGNSSTDGTGDAYFNYGIYERALLNRCGIINLSTAGTSAGNQAQFATTFAKEYTLYMGKSSHLLNVLGSNDVVVSTSKVQLEIYQNSINTYARTFGTKVALANLLPRGINSTGTAVTGITKAASAIMGVINSFNINDVISIGSISGMTQMNPLYPTITARTANSITVNVDSSAFSNYVLSFSGQTANFTTGQVITGGTSGATATIVSQADSGTTGTLTISGEVGVFILSEIITDPLGGSAAVASSGSVIVIAPAASQPIATGFGVGGVADLYNADVASGTMVSDWPWVNTRVIAQDPVVTTAWQVFTPAHSDDLTHPGGQGGNGLGYFGMNATFKANFNFLG